MPIVDAHGSRKASMVENWLPVVLVVGFVGLWFVMNKWILPKMGVST